MRFVMNQDIQTGEVWLYLAIVLDLFTREIIGWSIKPRMSEDIVTNALTMAWFRRKPDAGVIFHNDRGSQYASHAMTARLSDYGLTASKSRNGNFWDNAPQRKLLQQFEVRTGSWHDLRDDIRCAVRRFRVHLGVLQRSRRHYTLGYSSPLRFLEDWISKHAAQQPLAA